VQDKQNPGTSVSPQENSEDSQTAQYLEEEIIQIKIRRFVLQKLILASGINWAEDSHLRELMISLGSKLDL
jgi:hypothetical protein